MNGDKTPERFRAFYAAFGQPVKDTGINLVQAGLEHSQSLTAFEQEIGTGCFAEGFLSVLSNREKITYYGGWEQWLPVGAKLFAASAFGFLAFTTGEDLWLVDTQYGQVVESDFTLEVFLNDLAATDTLEMLQAELFRSWNKLGGSLKPTEFLSPVPLVALGGGWDISSLKPIQTEIFLSMTGQLFQKDEGMPAEVSYL